MIVTVLTIVGKNILSFDLNSNSDSSINVTFEEDGEYYILKNENGKVLLDGIKQYGDLYNEDFCNGIINVTLKNDKIVLINTKGKIVKDLSEYDNIDFNACYYTVSSPKGKKILKYDGSLFFEDKNDIYLENSSIECSVKYCSSKKVASFSTLNKYQLLNLNGDIIKEIRKENDFSKPIVKTKYLDEEDDSYVSVYYDNQTEIYDTKTFKLISKHKGNYYIKDVIHGDADKLLVLEDGIGKREVIAYVDGKETFRTSECFNAFFSDSGNIQCLIKEGGPLESFDLNGRKINE